MTTRLRLGSTVGAALRIAVLGIGMAGAASSDPSRSMVELAYEPSGQQITVILPGVIEDEAAEVIPPAWLERVAPAEGATAEERGAVFSGTLPEIDVAEPRLGADDDGAFLIGALQWLPANAEGAATEIRIRTPISHRGVATGELLSESTTDDAYTAVFRMAEGWRQTDLFFGPYEIAERMVDLPGGEVAARTYFKPAERDYAQDYLEAAERYITRYSGEIGPYPHPGFAVVSAPIPVGYAFDGLTYVSDQILGHPYMLGRSLAHEVLHSWWGSGVRINYDTGNWAEGLTTYQADYALAVDRGPDAAKDMRREWLAALSTLPPSADRPLREFRSSGHDRDQSVGYGKSAMVFHMLRQRVGETDFAAGLRRFWQDNEGETAGWTDLQRAFEVASGYDLSAFFTQWLDRTGLPEISLDAVDAAAIGDGYVVSVRVNQTDETYSVELPVVIETQGHETAKTHLLDEASAMFDIPVADRPLSVSVDPDFQTLRKLAEGELPPTLRDVLRSDSVAMIVGEHADAAADNLVEALVGNPDNVQRIEGDAPMPPVEALIAIGTTEEVASLRGQHFNGEAPPVAREGSMRAWVEEDSDDRLWLFVSAGALDAMSDELPVLRYYTSQSFVTLELGARAISGRWPVQSSPLRRQLDSEQ